MDIFVDSLHCYPVKSCQGISLQSAQIDRTGIQYDRQWMVVDEGMFVAQRGGNGMGISIPSICQVATEFDSGRLILTAPGMSSLVGSLERGPAAQTREVQVWADTCQAVDMGDESADWWTKYLSRERPGRYRFVRIADEGIRKARQGRAEVSFADGYPFLVLSRASLRDLNFRVDRPLPQDRFRANIWFEGCEAYEEDSISEFRVKEVNFFGQTLCVRCPVTTTNQRTGERGKEPLATLATYRKTQLGVVFGRNFSHLGTGTISVGDRVTVLGS